MADPQDDGKSEPGVDGAAKSVAAAIDTALGAQIDLLQVEFEALKRLMPCFAPWHDGSVPTDDTEIESNFDNMPV